MNAPRPSARSSVGVFALLLSFRLVAAETNANVSSGNQVQDPNHLVLVPLRSDEDDSPASPEVTRSSSRHWIVQFHQQGAQFGLAVASAGDVNRDGFADIIVGSPQYHSQRRHGGAAFLYLGSSTGLSNRPSCILESDEQRAYFGYSAAGGGDLNNDGFTDVLIGAIRRSGHEGHVFGYPGSQSGLLPASAWTARGKLSSAYFGSAVAFVGDMNGDGFSEVAVGAPKFFETFQSEGCVVLFYGSKSGLNLSGGWRASGQTATAYFGESLAAADFNNDGFSDLVIGAPGHDSSTQNIGRVELYRGATSGLKEEFAWATEGQSAQSFHGTSLLSAGDVNGDGFGDFFVGAPGPVMEERPLGSVSLYLGGRDLAQLPAWHVTGKPRARFGVSMAVVWNFLGDRLPCLFVGAPYTDKGKGQNIKGSIYVYAATAKGLFEGTPALIIEGCRFLDGFGSAVSSAGDINGDGFGDVILGSPAFDSFNKNEGRVDVLYGGPRSLLQETTMLSAVSNQNVGGNRMDSAKSIGKNSEVHDKSPLSSSFVVAASAAVAALISVGVWLKRRGRRANATRKELLADERARLARDLHDTVGSELTRISVLGELVKGNRNGATEEPLAEDLAAAAQKAMKLIEQVVWSVDPAHDTLESFVGFLSQYASYFFKGSRVSCSYDFPRDLPDIDLPRDLRQNLFLIVKEALNNVLKHADATKVHIAARLEKSLLIIEITDNGKGFEAKDQRLGGQGLKNLESRASDIGGRLHLGTSPGSGTHIQVTTPLNS